MNKVKMGLLLTLFLAFLLGVCYFSSFAFDIIILIFSLLAVSEFKNLVLKSGYPTFRFVPELTCFLVYVCNLVGILCGFTALQIILFVFVVVVLIYLFVYLGTIWIFREELEADRFRQVSNMSYKGFVFFKVNNTLSTIIYPTLLMGFAYLINHFQVLGLGNLSTATQGVPMGLFGILLVFAIACLSDTFAMAFGLLIKGKKLCPKISPKKTISGACFGLLGGIIGSLLVYLAFYLIFPSEFSVVSFWQFIIIGLIGSIISQVGDLFESFIKRRAQVKDSGDLFRSHGGVLDRLDSVIFLIPFVFVCVILLFA